MMRTASLKLFFILFLASLIPTVLLGQDKLDSIKKVALSYPKNDSSKVILLSQYIAECNKHNPDSARWALHRMKEISDSIQYKGGDLLYYRQLASFYRAKQMIDSARFYGKILLKKAKELNATKELAEAHNLFAIINYFSSDLQTAFVHLEKSLALFKTIQATEKMASIYNNMGVLHMEQGNNAKALNYFFEGLQTARETGNLRYEAAFNENIAEVYIMQHQYDQALKYGKESLKAHRKDKSSVGITQAYNLLGNISLLRENTENALDYYHKALRLSAQINNLRGKGGAYAGLAKLFDLENQTDSAKYYHKLNIKIRQKLNISSELVASLNAYAEHLSKNGKPEQAIEIGKKALLQGEKLGAPALIRDAAKALHTAYQQIGNYKEAYAQQALYIVMDDSIKNIENTRKLTEIKMRHEFTQKQQKLKLKQLAKDTASAQRSSQQRMIIIVFAFALLFAAVLVYLLLINNRRKLKDNQLLQEKNLKIAKQSKELEKLSAVASETDNAVLICSTTATIEWINKGAERLFGYRLNQFIDTIGYNLLKISTNPNIQELWDNVVKNGEVQTYESLSPNRSGSKIWTQTSLSPIFDKEGNVKKIVAVYTNINRLKEYEKELLTKSEEISAQRDELLNSNKKISLQNQQIRASLNYALSIQKVILPSARRLDLIGQHAVIYLPKDIVSGDFYWAAQTKDYVFFAVVDCTGHGVPGGFMSMISSTLLNNLIVKEEITAPEKILDTLNDHIVDRLDQKQGTNHDGLDITLCRMDKKSREIVYASGKQTILAHNANNEIVRLPNDRISIGGISRIQKKFNQYAIPQGTKRIYLYSDGFTDQCNADRNKIGRKNLVQLIDESKQMPINKQLEELKQFLLNWKGNSEQRDDITLLGFALAQDKLD